MIAALLALQLTGEIRPGLKPQTIVLVYHDFVRKRDSKALWFDCTPTELRTQLDSLEKKGAHFISLDQLYGHLTRGEGLPRHPIAITAADGYEGFYTYAAPVFRARRIPVAMFVHTDFVGSRTGRPKMTWEQLASLMSQGWFTAQSQTRTHPADLTKLGDKELLMEFIGSARAIETHLMTLTHYLAYPNGKFDGRVAIAAKRAGYAMALTEAQQPAESAASIYKVPRYVHTKLPQAMRDAGW
jgi:peptidoglycan/xylan/chitin deacetylase (PgdA/CDA1 family)